MTDRFETIVRRIVREELRAIGLLTGSVPAPSVPVPLADRVRDSLLKRGPMTARDLLRANQTNADAAAIRDAVNQLLGEGVVVVHDARRPPQTPLYRLSDMSPSE